MGRKANLNYRLCGVGVNDADYKISDCPYYSRWTSILKRCYSESYHKRKPTYIGCEISEEWVYFTNFKRWMETQDWEGKQLDKDLLVRGNKLYSAETCIFVSAKVNSFLAIYSESTKKSGLAIGVSKGDTGFISQGSDGNGKRLLLGSYTTEAQAHNAWKVNKLEILDSLIENEVGVILPVLVKLRLQLIDSIENGTIITKNDLIGR